MTKKERCAVFMIVATLGNIVVTFALFFGLVALYGATLGQILKVKSAGIAILACIVLSIVGSALIYNRVLSSLRKRPDLVEKYGLSKR
jgi:cytochrome c biogenesis protein CcdA